MTPLLKNYHVKLKDLLLGISSFEYSENLPKNLRELDLESNKIISFKGCENLPKNLEKLYIGFNQISSFEFSNNLPINLKDL